MKLCAVSLVSLKLFQGYSPLILAGKDQRMFLDIYTLLYGALFPLGYVNTLLEKKVDTPLTLPWPEFHFNAKWVQKRSFGGLLSKSASTLWQVRINNCMIFPILNDCFNNARSTAIGISMKCLHLPMRAKCYYWSRGSNLSTGLLGRPHLTKTVFCSGWSNRIAS